MSLEKVQELVSRALTVVNKINPSNQRKQVALATRLVTDASALKVRGTDPILKRIINELNSASEALDLTTRYIRLDFSELKKAPSELQRLAAMQSRPVVDEDEDEAAADRELLRVFEKFKTESKRVNLNNRPFGIFRVPIIAITRPMLTADNLSQVGIRAEEVSQYAVIHDQMVIGVDSRTATSKKSKPVQEAQRIADMISRSKNTKILLVTDKGNLQRGVWWYWAAESQTVNRLIRAARGNFQVSDWGFAFD